MFFCEFADNLCGSDNVFACESERSRSFQDIVKSLVTCFFKCESGQGVLNDRVFNACRTERLSQFGILRNGKTLVINKDAGSGSFDLLGKSRDDRFLFA